VTLAGRSIRMRVSQFRRGRRTPPRASVWHTSRMPSLTLGDFELSIFSDGTYPLDGGAFFGVIPKIMWSRKAVADERNYVQAGLNSLLIRTGKQNVLVETGMGNKLSERMIKFYGQPAQLLANLAAAESRPKTSTSSSTPTFISTTAAGIRCAIKMARLSQHFRARNTTRRKANGNTRAAQRARLHQLHPRELRPARRQQPDDAAQRRRRNRPRHLGENFPRPHRAHASGDRREPEAAHACYISDLLSPPPRTSTSPGAWASISTRCRPSRARSSTTQRRFRRNG
jgi:hypothetical protein